MYATCGIQKAYCRHMLLWLPKQGRYRPIAVCVCVCVMEAKSTENIEDKNLKCHPTQWKCTWVKWKNGKLKRTWGNVIVSVCLLVRLAPSRHFTVSWSVWCKALGKSPRNAAEGGNEGRERGRVIAVAAAAAWWSVQWPSPLVTRRLHPTYKFGLKSSSSSFPLSSHLPLAMHQPHSPSLAVLPFW